MKRKYMIFAAIILLQGILLALLCAVNGGSKETVVIGGLPDSSEAVSAFFDEIKAGEYENAMGRVGNYDTLGFEKQGSELIELYKQTIIDCYDVELSNAVNDETANRLEAVQGIEFTYFDCRLLKTAISEMTAEAAMDYMNSGNIIESDEQAMTFVYDALYKCLSEPEQYCVTEHFDVLLRYDGESWKLQLEQNLVDAMFGHIDDLSAEEVE